MSFIRDSPSPTCPLYMIHLHLQVHYTWLTLTFMPGIKLFTFKYMSVIHNLPSSTCPLYIFTFRDMSIIHAYRGQKKPLFHTGSLKNDMDIWDIDNLSISLKKGYFQPFNPLYPPLGILQLKNIPFWAWAAMKNKLSCKNSGPYHQKWILQPYLNDFVQKIWISEGFPLPKIPQNYEKQKNKYG